MNLKNKRILISGASFIGVHLIPLLMQKRVASIRVVNKTTKHKKNLKSYLKDIEFRAQDLRELKLAKKSVKNIDIVIHLAADHGGRGYVDTNQGNTASNFLLDGSVFYACLNQGIENIFYASSGCVYPNYMQTNPQEIIYLKEEDVKTPHDADNMYGWAKLMGELTLQNYNKDFGLPSVIGRLFTVYGPYASESHAVMGTIAKAFIKQDPFEVWGSGKQVRNWTYVEDIAHGIIKSLETKQDASVFNLGTSERITVDSMVELVLSNIKHQPTNIIHVDKPSGPLNRVADNSRAKKNISWEPRFSFEKGLKKTIDWYKENKSKTKLRKNLNSLLFAHS